jgi:PAS domain S-box-containing protein
MRTAVASQGAASPNIIDGIRRLFPEGLALPEEVWRARHRVIVRLLFLHAAGLLIFALARGFSIDHGLIEASPVAACAALGASRRLGRHTRSLAATFGMVTASAILVHLSGGMIEAHFHFFVMLGVISLYQSWRPFLLAIGYVVLHHGLMGALDAPSVYNHASAWNHPWLWAGIHGAFVLAASAAQLATWRFSESARRRAELMLESAGHGMVGIGSDGLVIFMNRGAADMLGVDRDEAIARSAMEVLGPTLEHGAAYPADRFPANGTLSSGDAARVIDDMWLSADDRRLPVELVSTPIIQHGDVIGAMVSFRDLTEYRAAVGELKSTLSLLTATLESTADGLLVVDGDGSITSFNQKFVEMWQIPDEIIASRDDDRALGFVLDQLKDPEAFLRKVRELYAEPDASSSDVLEFKDGRVVDRYSQPQRVDGVGVGRVWSFRDVTQQRRLDEMKDGFLSAVSHELRTPLTSVVGLASTLRRYGERIDTEQRDVLLDRLDANARKLQRLLTDILDLDRLGRGILDPRRQPTDVASLVRELVRETATFEERTISIDAAPGAFMLDGAKVERIIENLVTNAIRHTPDGTPIWVRVWAQDDGIVIAVEDEGPGVALEHRATIFEPFRQGPDILAHSPGVGVGLSLVARFAQLHGGSAWVQDREGGGASFRVYLPGPPADLDPVVDPARVHGSTAHG